MVTSRRSFCPRQPNLREPTPPSLSDHGDLAWAPFYPMDEIEYAHMVLSIQEFFLLGRGSGPRGRARDAELKDGRVGSANVGPPVPRAVRAHGA